MCVDATIKPQSIEATAKYGQRPAKKPFKPWHKQVISPASFLAVQISFFLLFPLLGLAETAQRGNYGVTEELTRTFGGKPLSLLW